MMHFQDSTGETWDVRVDVDAMMRTHRLTGVDLMSAVDGTGDLFRGLSEDLEALTNIVFAVCKPQADARGIPPVEFAARIGGDVFDAAAAALGEAIVRFFADPDEPPSGGAGGEKPTARLAWQRVWEFAGTAKVNPLPLTFHELSQMVESHLRDEWGRTAWLCALVASMSPYRRGPAPQPKDFNPIAPRREKPRGALPIVGITALMVFLPDHAKRAAAAAAH